MPRLRNVRGRNAAKTPPVTRRRRKAAQEGAERTVTILAYDGDQELTPAISGPEVSPFRHGDYLHVSDIIHKCVRQMAIADKVAARMPDQIIHASQAVTFELGRAVETFVERRLKAKSASTFYGTFLCGCADQKTSYVGVYKHALKQAECPSCGHKPLKYKELTLVNEELQVVGNVDFLLREQDHLILCELKSIADKGWQELERPMPEHLVQILIYWWMAREVGIPLIDKVCILYVNKQYLFGQSPYKEFVVQPSIEMRRIEDYLDDARAFLNYKTTGELPPRLQCPHAAYTKAKQCHVSNECFAYDPPRN